MTTSTKPTTSNQTVSTEVAAGVAQFLSPVVVDLQALAIDGKQAHWHVRGANFQSIHELLDGLVDEAQGYADDAAERIIALGLPVDARVATIAAQRSLPDLPAGFQGWERTVTQVVAQIDAALATVRAAVEGLDEVDLSSQDIAIEIERGLAKRRWLLQAHLAD